MKLFVLTAVVTLCTSAALAQTPPSAPATMPGMRRMPHIMAPLRGKMPSAIPSQQVIGNKKTHVYHFATDKSLPAPANRVMFSSVSAAVAAGYHMAGRGTKMTHPKMMPHTMTRPGPAAMPTSGHM